MLCLISRMLIARCAEAATPVKRATLGQISFRLPILPKPRAEEVAGVPARRVRRIGDGADECGLKFRKRRGGFPVDRAREIVARFMIMRFSKIRFPCGKVYGGIETLLA
jgi:hypothetical protein